MEEDDDFGELYTDVLRPFTTASTSPPPPQILPPIDLNVIDTPDDNNSDPQGLAPSAEKGGEVDLGIRVLEKIDDVDEDIDVVVEERDDKDENLVSKDDNLVNSIEVSGKLGEYIGGVDGSKMTPGMSGSGLEGKDYGDGNFDDEEESDSDSDDLQIVLNNDNEFGVMGMERMGGIGDGDNDDDDGDGLIILAENDGLGNPQMMENQEWGEEAGTGVDGERKELGDGSKVNGGVAVHPKVGYGNHAFHHPFHSQFKYVRPGATPLAGPVGTVGQVRPPVAGPTPGRGRGDWRPSGIKGGPVMQKGFGAQAWGSNSSGRGLDFTLPSHKTIFEVDIDSFEDKIWRLPGIDLSDFFNFGLNEEGWKEYCKQLEQHRLETTMQSRIRTYESGRTEQDYDPDLPPELAAASGALDIPSENITLVTTDPGQDASNRARPLPPTGRPIQVETNYTDRLPSIDTRQSRIRDSDAIIEINCQGSTDEDSPEADLVEPEDDHISDVVKGDEIQDISDEHPRKERRRSRAMPFSSKPSTHRPLGSREATPQFSGENTPIPEDGRNMKGRRPGRSPMVATSETSREKLSADDQKEKSYESIDGKHGRLSLSPESVGAALEQDVENQLSIPNEPVQENSRETEREGLDLDITSQVDILRDEYLLHSSEKQKSSSKVELSQETNERDYSGGASSDRNKLGSRNSKGLEKSHEAIDEVSQSEGSTHTSKNKRTNDRDGNMIRRKGYSETKDAGGRYTSAKGEESYPHKEWEPNDSNRLHAKTGGADRQRESDNSERALHKKVEGLHGRRTKVEDIRTRDHVEETWPSHRNKGRESERSEKDRHNHLREHLDIDSRRGNTDKIMGSKRNRDDGLKRRDGSMDSLHNKRRKEDGSQRREHTENEIIFHGNRDNSSSRRKRERDDVLDERKRDQTRVIDDDVYTGRYEEKGQFQRERGERQRDRDEWNLVKHSSEDMLSKRKREDMLSGMNNIRAAEEKVWSSHSRAKDEYRGSAREYYQKDATYHSHQHKRSDRTESESLVQHRGRDDIYAHGNQLRSDGKRARHEKVSTRDDRIANASDGHRVHEKKTKELTRKGKEREGGYPNSVKNQDEHSGLKSDLANSKGELKHGSSENRVHSNHRSSSAKLNEEVPSDDEQHHSRRGRSKLERWTSHKEMDVSTTTKSSSSSQIKEPEAQSSGGRSLGKVPNQHSKAAEDKQRSAIKDKDALESNNADGKSVENKHLDTVEKLKKRSERFKLPMPGEKEMTGTMKVENEALPLPPPPPPPPSSQPETRPDIEIKAERPARKRRWTSN